MMNRPDIVTLLERIAIALESIAEALGGRPPQPKLAVQTKKKIEHDLPQPANNDTCKIVRFLEARGFQIKTIPPEQEGDSTLDRIATFMGERFGSIAELLDNIKSCMNQGSSFTLNLKNYKPQAISDVTNLCVTLYNIAFLTEYNYKNSPLFTLYAVPSTSPKALNFFAGKWLERYIKTVVLSLSQARDLNVSYLCNPQIMLPSGEDFELDMLFEAEDEVFWLESKTGDYRRHIDKYNRVSKLLKLDKAHTFLILTDPNINDNLAEELGSIFSMTVVRIDNFAKRLEAALPAPKKMLYPNAEDEQV
ncbi:MAG: hypothetical protein RMM17_06780 [Acidobacteriota bacterium]|nr:hypothetical protein [Blastocatellia bacterium]MDW8412368.1 hypothetical protein [Acidobacteriota bacterium]